MRVHYFLFLLAMLSIGSSAILVRLANAPGTVCAFFRLLFSLPFVIVLNKGSFKGFDRLAVLSGIALGVHFSLWMDSLYRLPVFVSTAVVTTYPAFLALIEWKKEGFRPLSALGIALALLGTFSLFGLRGVLDPLGLLESLLGSLAITAYFWIGRKVRREKELGEYVLWAYAFAALTVFLYLLLVNVDPFIYLPRSFIWFLLMALVPMMGGHTVMNYLIKYYKAYVVSSIAFLEPIIAAILAYLIFGEVPPNKSLLPSLGIVLGVSLVVLSERYE
ncbi:hypothetical protein IPA_07355 [Ignicoccus pacificus DSM 13166]|uniref:EamA domain-containing protein n=1 Tax=Ignicoccus pacificus DSM 13166 TaxID=940294 RepID=A0A977KBM6_9CREN|nr:hypothetical protein IPA_07355 [Ignicoccus pacificus DSM 13166]